MRSRSIRLLLRATVSAFFVLVLVKGVDWSDVRELISGTDLFFLGLSFAVSAVLALLSAYKWSILLQAIGGKVGLGHLFQLYLVGYFFNNVLPSNVGGDVIRALEVRREIGDGSAAMASVFVERFTGLTALMILAIASFVSHVHLFDDRWFALAMLAAIGGYGLILAVLWQQKVVTRLERWTGTSRLGRSITKLLKLHAAIRSYGGRGRALAWAMVLSFLFYGLAVLNVYVSSLAFGVQVPFLLLVVIVPMILIISMMPISLGGIGLQEWAYFYTFQAIGAGGSLGLLVALLMRVKNLTYGLLGGLLYALRRGNVADPRAELARAAGTGREET